jgi:hypothetical protein
MPTVSLGSRRDRVLEQLYDVPVNGDRPVSIRGAEAAGEYGGRCAHSRETVVNPYVAGLTLQDAARDEARQFAPDLLDAIFLEMLQTVLDESSAVELLFDKRGAGS